MKSCLTLVAWLAGVAAGAWAVPARDGGAEPVRVVVVRSGSGDEATVRRLRQLGFAVTVVAWDRVDPARLARADVLLLPTKWAADPVRAAVLDGKGKAFREYVARGGGLLVCQPNPTRPGTCTPALLPYPITFQNHYDKEDPARENLAPAHFITAGLAGPDLPFPFDPMLKVDRRYTVLARQTKTGWASLAVARYEDGRVVVQTANESPGAVIHPLGDAVLRRMVAWAAGREPAE